MVQRLAETIRRTGYKLIGEIRRKDEWKMDN